MAPPASMKDRSHRLTAFVAKNGTQSQPASPRKTAVNGAKDDQRASSERSGSNEMDSFKVPVPKTSRIGELELEGDDEADDDNQSNLHVIDNRGSSAQEEPAAHLQYALEGSELGDSFMNSRISTPTTEMYDFRLPYSQRDGNGRRSSKNHRSWESRSSGPAFHIGDDMLMTVVNEPRRHADAGMRDGFSVGALPEYDDHGNKSPTRHNRQKSHQSKPTKLPLREVRVNRSHRPNDYQGKERGRESPRQRENYSIASRSTSPVPVGSEDSGSNHGEDDVQITPTGKPRRKSTGRGGAPHDVSIHALAGSPAQPRAQQNKRRRLNNLDYDDAALSSMSYQNLLNEPFDFDPAAAAAAASNGPAVTGNDGNRKMEQFRLAGSTEQQAMFANMSVDEWESAGDWFAEEFTSIMQKLREARRSKRNVIEGFEQEAATREEAVRQRSETLDRKLQKMREDGLRVVGDKKP